MRYKLEKIKSTGEILSIEFGGNIAQPYINTAYLLVILENQIKILSRLENRPESEIALETEKNLKHQINLLSLREKARSLAHDLRPE
jgi:hypothetical protein